MEKPDLPTDAAMRQATSTAQHYLGQGIEDIDAKFGEGYAIDHPGLLGAYMKTCAADFNTMATVCALWEIAEAIERAACNVGAHISNG